MAWRLSTTVLIALALDCVVAEVKSQTPTPTPSATTGPCVSPPPGMIRWWPGDGNANDIIAGNDGTLQNGASFDAGRVGQGFSLDGMSQYVESPAIDMSLTSLTIDAWIDANQIDGTIISKYDNSSTPPLVSFFFGVLGGKLRFAVYHGSTEYQVADTHEIVITTGTFTHVAGTFDSVTHAITIYVNGSEVASDPFFTAYISSILDSSVPIRIGTAKMQDGHLGPYFSGIIDEVQTFNRALAASEIQSIYAAGSAGNCQPLTTPSPTPSATATATATA